MPGWARDLIEAGLSEPAGWRNGLWGLCCQRLAREADARDGIAGWTVAPDDDGGDLRWEVVVVDAAPPMTTLPGPLAVAPGGSGHAGAWSARSSIGSYEVA